MGNIKYIKKQQQSRVQRQQSRPRRNDFWAVSDEAGRVLESMGEISWNLV